VLAHLRRVATQLDTGLPEVLKHPRLPVQHHSIGSRLPHGSAPPHACDRHHALPTVREDGFGTNLRNRRRAGPRASYLSIALRTTSKHEAAALERRPGHMGSVVSFSEAQLHSAERCPVHETVGTYALGLHGAEQRNVPRRVRGELHGPSWQGARSPVPY
jgi:hypothetical protein